MCKFYNSCFWNIFSPKSFHILRRNGPNLQETSRNKEFVGNFLLIERWGNEYCHHVRRAWRQAKSCSPGVIGHPPTISIRATDQAFDSLIHLSLPTNPRLWHGYFFFHKWTSVCWCTQDKMFTWHMKKYWKWGVEIHHFYFIGPGILCGESL
jgi:hypothetical protein